MVMKTKLLEVEAGQNGWSAGRLLAVSVVVPIMNEVESLPHLISAIATTLIAQHLSYEIICVDDGSTDGSAEFLKQEAQTRTDLKAVLLRRNYGQTAAMAAGFNYARGTAIVTLDGDLQNDPADIPRLLAKLEEGYDLVSGWRQERQDARGLPCAVVVLLRKRHGGVDIGGASELGVVEDAEVRGGKKEESGASVILRLRRTVLRLP